MHRSIHHSNNDTVETGLSDFHTMVVSVAKSKYQKEGPSTINYRKYKDFKLEDFRKDSYLEINKLQANKIEILNYRQFETAFNEVIDEHVP